MKLTDRRLYQSRNLEDFTFRYWFRDEDNQTRRSATREAVFYAAKAFVAPDTNRIWGPDVSGRWDGLVDFRVTANYGAKFAIVKAIDGTIPTAYWRENNQSAYDAGLLNSVYAWLYPDSRINCTLQARAFYDLVKDARLRLPPVLDFEWTRYAGIQANPNYADLRKWLAEFIRLSGVKPILYTAAGYVDLFGAIPADILAMLSGVHVASYGGTQPIMPRGVAKWDMWQFTANGDAQTLCPGNQGKLELDLNYMAEELYQRYAATEPQTGETTVTRYQATNLYPNMSLRAGHDTGAGFIKSFPTGTLWHGDTLWIAPEDKWLGSVQVNKVGDKWLQVSDVGGNTAYTGWVAITHLGREWCALTDTQPPEPPVVELPNRFALSLDGQTWKWYVAE